MAPNHLDRKYQVKAITGLNQVWAGDITYITIAPGLAVSGGGAGPQEPTSHRLEHGRQCGEPLVQDALHLAATQRELQRFPKGEKSEFESELLFHSDRGSQYASHNFQSQLWDLKAKGSMSGKGNAGTMLPSRVSLLPSKRSWSIAKST